MSYLLSVHWVWSILASILGGLVGALTFKRGDNHWFGRWMDWAAALFIVGLTVSWLTPLPGRAGFWLETALLLFAVYIIGCLLGWHLRALVPVLDVSAPPRLAAGMKALSAAQARLSPMTERFAKFASPARPTRKTKLRSLASPRNEAADDLQMVMGIGPKTEAGLHALGIFRFDQIAAWTPEEAAYVGTHLGFPGRAEQKHWIEQARLLAAGIEAPHSKKRQRKRATIEGERAG